MKKRVKALVLLLLVLIIALPTVTTRADGSAWEFLVEKIHSGKYTELTNGVTVDCTQYTYKLSGGGYAAYSDLVDLNTVVNESNFQKLTSSEKQRFLGNIFSICNALLEDSDAGNIDNSKRITDDTVQQLMTILQSKTGMGTQLLATLLQNTKPDFVSANRLYQPFSGVVGTILGVISILIMALLGVTMALDIAYIVIPAFQLILNGDTDASGTGGKAEAKGMNRIISIEARQAVAAVEDSGGQNGQGGGTAKSAIGIYLKRRWKGLVILGICLLYLVQGQIWGLVGWVIDMLSGFLG